jgi:hypothetical protein
MPVETRLQARRKGEIMEQGLSPSDIMQSFEQAPTQVKGSFNQQAQRVAQEQGFERPEQIDAANTAQNIAEAGQMAAGLVEEKQKYDFEPLPMDSRRVSNSLFPSFPGSAEMAQSSRMMQEGLAMGSAAEAQAADIEAANLASAAEVQAEVDRNAREQLERLNNKVQEIGETAINLNSRLQELKVDPNRFWNSRSTGQKALLILGAGMTSFGGGDGFGQVMSLVDRDIKLQQDEFDRMGGQVKNMVSIMSQLYGPGEKAVLMSRSWALENLKTQLEARMAATRSPQIRAQGVQAIAQIQAQQAEFMQRTAQLSLQTELQLEESAKLGAELADKKSTLDQVDLSLNKLTESLGKTTFRRGFANNQFTQELATIKDALVAGGIMEESAFNQIMRPSPFESNASIKKRIERLKNIVNIRKSNLERVQGRRVQEPTGAFQLDKFQNRLVR